MAIIGFNFLKINSEKNFVKNVGKIEINHNISIKDVKKAPLKIGGNNNDVLKIEFLFSVIYGDSLGNINLVGEVIYTDTKEIISETEKGWNADKKLNAMVNKEILNFVYTKTIIKALEIADLLNLPSPIPMPKINLSELKNK